MMSCSLVAQFKFNYENLCGYMYLIIWITGLHVIHILLIAVGDANLSKEYDVATVGGLLKQFLVRILMYVYC